MSRNMRKRTLQLQKAHAINEYSDQTARMKVCFLTLRLKWYVKQKGTYRILDFRIPGILH